MTLPRLFIISIFTVFLFTNSTISLAKQDRELSSKQQTFLMAMTPNIEKVNEEILIKRHKLLTLYKHHKMGKPLTNRHIKWLNQQAHDYQISKPDWSNNIDWQQLLGRLDIIPTDLMLAQSINESGWGSSRFAKEGKNYFGQWCFTVGCGIVPKQRPANATYEVKKFDSVTDSIRSYTHNLNTNSSYRDLRTIRFKQRLAGQTLSGQLMAKGLLKYSAKGHVYIDLIQHLITHYDLQNYATLPKKSIQTTTSLKNMPLTSHEKRVLFAII